MLVIKIELWPYGDEKKAKLIGVGAIANVGRDGAPGFYNYQGVFLDDKKNLYANSTIHYRDEGFWPLVGYLMPNYNSLDLGWKPSELKIKQIKRPSYYKLYTKIRKLLRSK